MKPISQITLHASALCALVAVLDGCSGGMAQSSLVPPVPALSHSNTNAGVPKPSAKSRAHRNSAGGYVYVSNWTQAGSPELLVYRADTQDPSPIRTVTQGLVDVAGVAVDSSGDVYVANGSGGNVLEFSPGGASLVQTYSQDLYHPIGVTIAGSTLYVADLGQVLEYSIGNGNPTNGIAGIGAPGQSNEGIAVNPLGNSGTFFASASTLSNIPPSGICSTSGAYTVAEDVMPTLWLVVPLTNNEQASGIAFDAEGNLYVADPCANKIAVYSDSAGWTYSHSVQGTFETPFLLTINSQFLAVPSAGSGSASGFATIVDLSGDTSTVTITKGLQHPVGAAVAPGS
ncbi:MAG TPA: hypothetical protein VFF63_00330 [Candidatus Babeliales bacterium]|nr:hypothetical protein [Candidatus Babeliales bacterium]